MKLNATTLYKRRLVVTLAAMAGLALAAPAQAQGSYPNKPIRMIVPLAAGSAVDVAARLLAQKMAENMGQSIVVENIVGASGIIGGLVSGTAMRFWAERAAFLAGLVLVPAVIARIAQTRGTPLETNSSSTWPLLVIAGLLVGLGTRLANGCTSGHGVCGISRLSPRGIAATAAYLGAGFVTMAIGRNLLGWF